ARPIPLAAPVTIAALPCSRPISCSRVLATFARFGAGAKMKSFADSSQTRRPTPCGQGRQFFGDICFLKNIRYAIVFSVAISVPGFVGREPWVYEKGAPGQKFGGRENRF